MTQIGDAITKKHINVQAPKLNHNNRKQKLPGQTCRFWRITAIGRMTLKILKNTSMRERTHRERERKAMKTEKKISSL